MPLSYAGVARETVGPRELVGTLRAIMLGQPIVRYKDRAGRPCMKPLETDPPDGVVVEVVYPSVSEMTVAAKILWDRLEPKEHKLMIEMANGGARPKVQLTGAKLDEAIALREQLRRLEQGDEDDEALDVESEERT